MTRNSRIIGITLGLVAAGGVFGALAGVAAFVIGARITHAPAAATELRVLPLPALIGAVLGVLVLPITAWLLLRRVALGLAVAAVLVGTIAGGTLGLVVPFAGDRGVSSITGGCLGFLLAAIALSLRARASAHRPAR